MKYLPFHPAGRAVLAAKKRDVISFSFSSIPAFFPSSQYVADTSVVLPTWKFNFCTQLLWNWEKPERSSFYPQQAALRRVPSTISCSIKGAITILQQQNNSFLSAKIFHRLSKSLINPKSVKLVIPSPWAGGSRVRNHTSFSNSMMIMIVSYMMKLQYHKCSLFSKSVPMTTSLSWRIFSSV